MSLTILLDRIAAVMLKDNRVKELLTLVKSLLEVDVKVVSVSTARLLLQSLSQTGMEEEYENVSVCEIGNVVCEKCHVQSIR